MYLWLIRRALICMAVLTAAFAAALLSSSCLESRQEVHRQTQVKDQLPPPTSAVPPIKVEPAAGKRADYSDKLERALQLKGRIAFASEQEGESDLFLVALAGMDEHGSTARTRLTHTPAISEAFPAWSPKGDMISFLAKEGPKPARLYLLAVSGTKASKPKAISAAGHNATGASWSPGGGSILYSLEVNGATEIIRYDLATGRTSQLTLNGNPDGGALWSAGGRSVFWSPAGNTRTDVWVMGGGGANKRRLLGGPGEQGADCVIGDDLLGVTLTENDEWEVGIFSLSAKRLIASTRNRHYDAGIRCGPDGNHVAWTSMKGSRWDIMMADVPARPGGSSSGTILRPLNLTAGLGTSNTSRLLPIENVGPAWSPGGRFIAFESNAEKPDSDGGRHIYAVEIATGKIVQITGGPGSDRMPAWTN